MDSSSGNGKLARHTDPISLIDQYQSQLIPAILDVTVTLPARFDFGPEAGRRDVVRFSLAIYLLREAAGRDPL